MQSIPIVISDADDDPDEEADAGAVGDGDDSAGVVLPHVVGRARAAQLRGLRHVAVHRRRRPVLALPQVEVPGHGETHQGQPLLPGKTTTGLEVDIITYSWPIVLRVNLNLACT